VLRNDGRGAPDGDEGGDVKDMNEARDPKESALEEMRESLAAEQTPALPWDRMERDLLAKIAQGEPPKREVARLDPKARFVIGFAAAAAVVLAVGLGARSSGQAPMATAARWRSPESIAFLPGSDSEHDLSAMRAGDGVEACEAPLVLVRRGVVRVTLAPFTRAFVLVASKGPNEPLVLGLERGSLRAEVTPRHSPEALLETFAVDVGQTRVAAHGTAFRVTREADVVLVDLEHGSVAVGPAGRPGSTNGRLLVGRARASFSLDGALTAKMLPVDHALTTNDPPTSEVPPEEPAPAVALAPSPTTNAERTSPHHSSPPSLSPAPSPTEEVLPAPSPSVEPEAPPERVLSRAAVSSGLKRCFDQHYAQTESEVRISVSGTLHVSLDERGSVSSVRFDPPLEPAFMTCVFGSLKPGHFEDARPFSMPFQLGR